MVDKRCPYCGRIKIVFVDHKDINTQVMALNETTLNVFRNYVPNKHITIDDKDPVWMNETIKSKIKTKN